MITSRSKAALVPALLLVPTPHSLCNPTAADHITWEGESTAQPVAEPKKFSFNQLTSQIPKPVTEFGSNAIARIANPESISALTAMFLGLATSGALYIVYKASCKDGDSFDGELVSGLGIKILAPGQNQPLATRLIDGFMSNGFTAVTLSARIAGRAYIMIEVTKIYKEEEAKKVSSGDKTVMHLHNAKHSIDTSQSGGMLGQVVATVSPELVMFVGLLGSFGGSQDNSSDDAEKVKKREARNAQLYDIMLVCCTASIKDVFDIAAFTAKVCGCDMRITITAPRFNPIEFDLPGTLSSGSTYICGAIAAWRVARLAKDLAFSKDEKESKKAKIKFAMDVFGKQYKSILEDYFEYQESPTS